jgi:hypothetical protein
VHPSSSLPPSYRLLSIVYYSDELDVLLQHLGVTLTPADLELLLAEINPEKSGEINFDQFYLCEALPPPSLLSLFLTLSLPLSVSLPPSLPPRVRKRRRKTTKSFLTLTVESQSLHKSKEEKPNSSLSQFQANDHGGGGPESHPRQSDLRD